LRWRRIWIGQRWREGLSDMSWLLRRQNQKYRRCFEGTTWLVLGMITGRCYSRSNRRVYGEESVPVSVPCDWKLDCQSGQIDLPPTILYLSHRNIDGSKTSYISSSSYNIYCKISSTFQIANMPPLPVATRSRYNKVSLNSNTPISKQSPP